MKCIEWDLSYSIGVQEIDGQHKTLMNLLNEAIHNSSGNKEKERAFFDKRIDKIIEFIETHYKTEEQYLSKANYEEYNEHILEHEYILKIMQKIKDDIINNKIEIDLFNITANLKEVLLNHVKFYDKSAKVAFCSTNFF
jgi:hemerythrin